MDAKMWCNIPKVQKQQVIERVGVGILFHKGWSFSVWPSVCLSSKPLFFSCCSGISLSLCDWKTFNLSSYMYCPVTFYNNKAFVLAEVGSALGILQRGYKQKGKKGKQTVPLQVIPLNFELSVLHIRSALNPFMFYLYSCHFSLPINIPSFKRFWQTIFISVQ